jgi:hypothetical protein
MSDILMSILGGGATGLLGTVFGQVMGLVDKAQERKFILQKHRLDAEIRTKETESAQAIAEVNASSQALSGSYGHDSSFGPTSVWVSNIRSLVRPMLTLLLWLVVTLIWYSVVPSEATLREQIIGTVLYCATAATLWWFGSRDTRKR